MNEGRFEEACQVLEALNSQTPRAPTALALGGCYEKAGKLASALRAYKNAAELAGKAMNDALQRVAKEQVGGVRARVSEMVILAPTPSIAGLRIEVDGHPFAASSLRNAVPIDGGTYLIQATAPGFDRWAQSVVVRESGDRVTVVVPALNPLGAQQEKGAGINTLFVIGSVLSGVGFALIGAGAGVGYAALSKRDEAKLQCPLEDACLPAGVELMDSADTLATASTALWIVGGALLASGIGMWIAAPVANPKKRPDAVRAAIGLAPTRLAARIRW